LLGWGFLLLLKLNLFFAHYLLHVYYTVFTYLIIFYFLHHLFKSTCLLPNVNNSLRTFSYLYLFIIYHLLLLLGEASDLSYQTHRTNNQKQHKNTKQTRPQLYRGTLYNPIQ